MSPFAEKVIQEVRRIPSGRVATYKQIAELAGKPHASRGVSWILNSCSKSHKLPWHRVLSSQGRLSFAQRSLSFRLQKSLLQREGVEMTAEGKLDLKQYQWSKAKS